MSDHHNHNPTAPATFTRSVLNRLQLDPCAVALEQLLDDSCIETASLQSKQPQPLIAQHLQHCESCRALQVALLLSQSGLSGLRYREAPAGLLERTLQQTARNTAPPRLRTLSRLQHWLLRPRFALESAYLGSLLFVLVIGLPVSNAIDMQQVELEIAQQIDQRIDQQLARLQQLISQGEIVRNENISLLERTYQNGREDWRQLTQNTRAWLQQYNTPWIDSIKTAAEIALPSSSKDTTGAPQ